MKCFLNRDYVENFIRYHKKTIIKVAAGILLFAATFFVFCIRDHEGPTKEFHLMNGSEVQQQKADSAGAEEASDSQTEEKATAVKSKIYIDIGGAVHKPYVYEMQEGARVYEAIELAGGLTAEADVSSLNLAQVLKDEDKIMIYTKKQMEEGSMEDSIKNNKVSQIAGGNTSRQFDTDSSQGLININTAGSDALQTITGIGPSTAEKIISYRQEHGSFKKIEDLMNVSGIGQKTFDKLKSKITV